MDRNHLYSSSGVDFSSLSARRAWIEIKPAEQTKTLKVSLSARRAWIEIRIYDMSAAWNRVALRKESVDRNYIIKITEPAPRRSLSARRAWIEMSGY